MRWTPGDEVVLRLFGKMVELAFLAVPDENPLAPAGVGRLPPRRGTRAGGRAAGAGTGFHRAAA